VVYIGDNSREVTAYAIPGTLDGGSGSGSSTGSSSGSSSGSSTGSATGTSSGSSGTETALSRASWVASASVTQGGSSPTNAINGAGVRWTTGTPMTDGMWFEVNMASAQTFNEITMDSGGSTNDYARGYDV
jgi:beta-glucosidase